MTRHQDSTAGVPLEEIVDQCVDAIAAGRLTLEEALAQWPVQREALEPLLEVAIAMHELPPIPDRAPDPDRRAAFMEAMASTPQDTAPGAASERSWLGGLIAAFPRVAAVAAPAAVIAIVARTFVLSTGGDTASASTLTIFAGAVEHLIVSRHDCLSGPGRRAASAARAASGS